ncbi:MAG: uroporphyrinogen decarboxylase family protein [Anaerolineae bacterium]|nr:uroporphyrinogen decarboxylase family protein [Anaerolineae bacterium]
MNSTERLKNRLAGSPVDRAPNFCISMAFGAHFIGQPLRKYYLDHQVLVNANLAMLNYFRFDILQAISDPYREACDLGLPVEFPEDDLPVRIGDLIVEEADIQKVKPIDPSQGRRMVDRLEAIRIMRAAVGNDVPVMGWVEGALAEAADLRGVSAIMLDLIDRPDWVKELLERCTEIEIEFARAQIQAGATIIGLGDAIASQISPRLYRQFALPYEQRIFQAVNTMGSIPRLHICGDTSRILADMAESGARIIDVDWMVDFEKACTTFDHAANQPVGCGNFDPVQVAYFGTPAQVAEAVRTCLKMGGPRSILAAGCEIPDKTPIDNVLAISRELQTGVDFVA